MFSLQCDTSGEPNKSNRESKNLMEIFKIFINTLPVSSECNKLIDR